MRPNFHPYFLLVLCWTLSILTGYNQNVHSVNHKKVLEMEAVQAPSGTFVTSLMEEADSTASSQYCIAIYRSTDNGTSWDYIKKIQNDSMVMIGDPVMTIDSSGTISLVFMGMPQKDSFITVHLQLYQSTDDGLTWQFKGEPYSGSEMADYPQIISSGPGKLHLTYTIYSPETSINYVSSSDGGISWSAPVTFTYGSGYPVIAFMGCDIGITGSNAYCLAFGDASHDSIYFSISTDSGNTWGSLDTIPGVITSTVNKVISRKGLLPIGIISHQPHVLTKPLYFSVTNDQGSTWTTRILSESASYGEGYLDANGLFHVIYSFLADTTYFNLQYTFSDDGGVTFKDPVTLYSGLNNVNWSAGEYQSLVLAKDNLFHLTFVDNSDSAHTKQIIFAPLLQGISQPPIRDKIPRIFPNPVQDVINIEIPQGSDFTQYEITDILGKKLQEGNLYQTGTQIEISQKAKGLLILRLNSPNRVFISKIIR